VGGRRRLALVLPTTTTTAIGFGVAAALPVLGVVAARQLALRVSPPR
jgi:hypothetical protein